MAMNTKEAVLKALNDICGHICDRIRLINYGGCGVFAYELAKVLQRYGATDFRIRVWSRYDEYYDPTPVDVSEVEKIVIEEEGGIPNYTDPWNANSVYFNHIRLEFDNFFWDAVDGAVDWVEGFVYDDAYYLLDGSMSLEALAAIAECEHNWNPDFNRDQISLIREYIENTFQKHLTT